MGSHLRPLDANLHVNTGPIILIQVYMPIKIRNRLIYLPGRALNRKFVSQNWHPQTAKCVVRVCPTFRLFWHGSMTALFVPAIIYAGYLCYTSIFVLLHMKVVVLGILYYATRVLHLEREVYNIENRRILDPPGSLNFGVSKNKNFNRL